MVAKSISLFDVRFYIKLSFLIFFIQLTINSTAQFYEYGQDAGSIRWNSFSSKHYRLIYPRKLDSLAMAFADRLEYYYPYQAKVLDYEHKRIPVILHNESSFSNGSMAWAPKRLDIFTNPNPNGYPQEWLTLLAIHEGRHAFQISKLNQGFTKGLSYITGEQIVGAISGMLPLWYLEGDAVDAETRFSNSGRGRIPSFEMGMKAILLEKEKRYSFSKALLGSYNDYSPNHYQLGYLMVHYGRKTYGDSFWIDMEDFVARKPYLLIPGYFSMKKYGVSSKKELYNQSLNFYSEHWKKSLDSRNILLAKSWSGKSKFYTNYNFPQWINDSLLITYKTGMDQIPEFVTIDTAGEEERVFRPGYLNSGRFSYRSGMIIWDEWVPDIRWTNRNYSVIRLFDLETGKVRQLGSKTRYYSPAFSKNGRQIVAVEQLEDYTFYIVVLDLEGNVLHKVKAPGNFFPQQPNWMEQDSAIVITMNQPSGESLYTYSLRSKKWNEVYNSGFDDLSFPVVNGSEIYFGSTFSGIDNIYSLNLKSGELHRISSAAFGAVEPSISADSKTLLFADYHSDGYRAATVDTDHKVLVEAGRKNISAEQIDTEHSLQEKMIIDGAGSIQKGDYEPKPYRKLLHSINIHSWSPFYFDYLNPEAAITPEELPVSIGATVLTQNMLSTVTGMLAYEYKEKMHYLHSGVRLKGKYPVVDMSVNYGGYPMIGKINEQDSIPIDPNRLTFSTSTYIPFRLNTGKFISIIQPYFSYTYTSDILPDESHNHYESGIHKMHYRIYLSSTLRRGKKDILPVLGISAYAGYANAPFNSYNYGSLSYSGLVLYLPGVLKHQTLRLKAASQLQSPENYFFHNFISLPRGTKGIKGLGLKLYSADYAFPIAYPDWNIDPLIYIKRIRGNLWTDFLQGTDIYITDPDPLIENRNYYSYGADLLFDFNFVRLFFPFSMGARVGWQSQSAKVIPEFLFSIDVR